MGTTANFITSFTFVFILWWILFSITFKDYDELSWCMNTHTVIGIILIQRWQSRLLEWIMIRIKFHHSFHKNEEEKIRREKKEKQKIINVMTSKISVNHKTKWKRIIHFDNNNNNNYEKTWTKNLQITSPASDNCVVWITNSVRFNSITFD